jgi:hypothetical protein
MSLRIGSTDARALGAAYFRAKRFEDADRTFREDLERNPGNPRSLFALWQMVGVTGEPDDLITLDLGLPGRVDGR